MKMHLVKFGCKNLNFGLTLAENGCKMVEFGANSAQPFAATFTPNSAIKSQDKPSQAKSTSLRRNPQEIIIEVYRNFVRYRFWRPLKNSRRLEEIAEL